MKERKWSISEKKRKVLWDEGEEKVNETRKRVRERERARNSSKLFQHRTGRSSFSWHSSRNLMIKVEWLFFRSTLNEFCSTSQDEREQWERADGNDFFFTYSDGVEGNPMLESMTSSKDVNCSGEKRNWFQLFTHLSSDECRRKMMKNNDAICFIWAFFICFFFVSLVQSDFCMMNCSRINQWNTHTIAATQ